MLYQAMQYAAERSGARGNDQRILLLLAYHANTAAEAYPSIATLKAETGLSERQVQRCLRSLEAAGHIRVSGSRTGGRAHTTRYTVATESPFTSAERVTDTVLAAGERVTPATERVTPATERVTFAARKGDTAMAPEDREDRSEDREVSAPPTPPPPSAPTERQRLVREWCALTGARRLNPAQEAKLYAVATTTAERGEPGTLTEMMRYAAEHATASPWAFFLRLVEAYDRGDPWRRPALTVVPGGGKPKRQAHDDLARDLTAAEWDEELLKARAINKNVALPPHLEAVWQARQQQRAVS